MEEKGSGIRVASRRRGRRKGTEAYLPPTYMPSRGFWRILGVPGATVEPNRGFEVRNPAGALRTQTPTVLSTHLVQGRNAHRDAQAKNALTSIPPPPSDLHHHPNLTPYLLSTPSHPLVPSTRAFRSNSHQWSTHARCFESCIPTAQP